MVEAFEYMPASYMRRLSEARPDVGEPFSPRPEVTILVELGATAPRDCSPGADGQVPLTGLLEDTLATLMEEGLVLDALVAQSQAQRAAMWQRRELAAEITFARRPLIDTDIALPLDGVAPLLAAFEARLPTLDAGAETLAVAHLGDGNIHLTIFPSREDATLADTIVEMLEEEVLRHGGSFSAEHGVGLSKRPSMARRKDPVALAVMRQIKAALDPHNLMNPGKVLP